MRPLPDALWAELEDILPRQKVRWLKRKRKGGRPRLSDRLCFEGLLWLLRRGAAWRDLPSRYGAKSAVHARIQEWADHGILTEVWVKYLAKLNTEELQVFRSALRSRKAAFGPALLHGAFLAHYPRA